MKVEQVEIGRFNGLTIMAKLADMALSPAAYFLQNTAAFKGSGLVVWLTPVGKVAFAEETMTKACVDTMSELARELRPAIGPTVRHTILDEFWPKASPDLLWHMAVRDLKSGPVIELVVATKRAMEILIASWHCERNEVFS